MIESQTRHALPSASVRRRLRFVLAHAAPTKRAEDIRLFAITFVAGFLFFSIFLA
ncbi:hypothetical protein [Sphingomonas sp. DBB INV C78]|uniref:hypothetical protein n=1 Tax=Sphingomonas sp. DBB INV C78 TaxID=3349434 RepID=UPI0036D35E4F